MPVAGVRNGGSRGVRSSGMATRTTSWLSWPGLARTLLDSLRITLRLLREPAVPLMTKGLPIAAVLYVLSPLDFVPDVLPLIGQLDDAGLLLLAIQAFLRLCPASVVAHHRSALAAGRPFSPVEPGGQVIDAEFRRHDDAR